MFCTCGGGLAIDFVQTTMQIYEKKIKSKQEKIVLLLRYDKKMC